METINTLNTIKEIESYRKSLNEACDNREKFVIKCRKAIELSKGSFLLMKEAFEAMSPMLFETKDGKILIKHYKDVIKNNSSLKNMHSICENIRKANKDIDIQFFINNMTEYDWSVNKKVLSEGLDNLGRVLSEAYMLLGEKADGVIPAENHELANAIEFIAENKKSYNNISEYSEAARVLKENIEKVESKERLFKNNDLNSIAEGLINSFNSKYTNQLSDEEKQLVREMAENSDKSVIFEKYKSVCSTKIEEAKENSKNSGDSEAVSRLETINEQIAKKSYKEDTFSEDICSLLNMINVLS